MPNNICDLVLSEDVDLMTIRSSASVSAQVGANPVSQPINSVALPSPSPQISRAVPNLIAGMPIENSIAISTATIEVELPPVSVARHNLAIQPNPLVAPSLPIYFDPAAGPSSSIVALCSNGNGFQGVPHSSAQVPAVTTSIGNLTSSTQNVSNAIDEEIINTDAATNALCTSPLNKKRQFEQVNEISDAAVHAHSIARSRRRGLAATNLQGYRNPSRPASAARKIKNKNANVIFSYRLLDLMDEVLSITTNLSDDPTKIHGLHASLQDFGRKVQILLGKSYRLHILVESAIPNRDICRKYRGCVPLFSTTLLPAFEVKSACKGMVAGMLTEALSISECVLT